MITEDYVSLETAKLLKDKGFDEKCMSYYSHGKFQLGRPKYMRTNTDRDGVAFNGVPYDAYSAPTLQMAMKWLREVQGLDIDVSIEYAPKKTYYYSILKKTVIRDIDCLHSETNFKSYEEACEAAIRYCLENLI